MPAPNGDVPALLTVIEFPLRTNWPDEICDTYRAGWVVSPVKDWGLKVNASGPFRVTVAPVEAAPLMVAAVDPTAVPVPLALTVMLPSIEYVL